MRSLRAKLLVGTISGAVTVLLAAGIAAYAMARSHLVGQFDRALADKAQLIASTLEYEHGKTELDDDLEMTEFAAGTVAPAYLQLWLPDGQVLFRSSSLGTAELPRPPAPPTAPRAAWVTLPDGRRGRALAFAHVPRVEKKSDRATVPRVVVVMARGTESIDSALDALQLLLSVVGVSAVLVTATMMWLVVSRSLHPLKALAAQIGGLDESQLTTQVVVPEAPAELAPVIERLNELMGRISVAFARERSFSADVAHELRTPLAGLRSILEITPTRKRETGEYEQALADCLAIVTRMQSMTDNLLALARLDAGWAMVDTREVELAEVVTEQWQPLASKAEQRRLAVEWNLGDDCQLETEVSLLAMAVRNLLDNAVEYAEEGGRVTLTTRRLGQTVEFEVTNTGCRLDAEAAPHAVERFWRGDAARNVTEGHCGLGLALVDQAAAAVQGECEIRAETDGIFVAVLRLPASDESPVSKQ